MNGTHLTPPPARPWFREPWPWLLIAIPGLTVVAGLVTLGIAIRHDDAVVVDDYRREGLAIHRDLRRDAAARSAGLTALLQHDETTAQLTVRLAGLAGIAPDRLLLILSHATRAQNDRMILLTADGQHYRATLAALPPGHWHLEIGPADRRWRLRGEFHDHIGQRELAPPPES